MTGNMMIATILQRDPQSLRECIAVWRQLSDIVAQRGMQLNQSEIQQSLRTLARLRNKVPEQVRRDTALSVAHHGRFAPLVALFANDTVMVAAAMLQNALLPTQDWLALLPATNDVARSILAGRNDLPSPVRRALQSLGAGAVALPPSELAGNSELAGSDELSDGKSSLRTQPVTAYFADEQAIIDRQSEKLNKSSNFELDHIEKSLRNTNRTPNVTSDDDRDRRTKISQISELVRRIDRFQSSRSHAIISDNGDGDDAVTAEPSSPIAATSPKSEPVSAHHSGHYAPAPQSASEEMLSAMKAIEADIRAKFAESQTDLRSHAPRDLMGGGHETSLATAADIISPAPQPSANPAKPGMSDMPAPSSLTAEALSVPAQFQFQTDSDGMIVHVDGVSPSLVIGMTIACAALGTAPGTDGAAAGAFRQHAEIINARMRLGGASPASGEWRFSAAPIFDRPTGQFQGYNAVARRPLRRDNPYGQSEQAETGDTLRQLIHELRSPLNAISGFAQIIAGEMFGPVSASYRAMAESIIEDAANVQAIIEDLDIAAGHSAARNLSPTDHGEVTDIADVVDFVARDLQLLLADNRIGLSITQEGGPFVAHGDSANARRMVGRLLTALIDISEADSLLVAQLIADLTSSDMMQFRVVRPSAIRFTDAAQLLDPGYSPDGEAPAADILSLGFSLRLVGSLASNCGGELEITPNAIILHLPLATSGAHQNKDLRRK